MHCPPTHAAVASQPRGRLSHTGGSHGASFSAQRVSSSISTASTAVWGTASNGGTGSHSPQQVIAAGINVQSASTRHSTAESRDACWLGSGELELELEARSQA